METCKSRALIAWLSVEVMYGASSFNILSIAVSSKLAFDIELELYPTVQDDGWAPNGNTAECSRNLGRFLR